MAKGMSTFIDAVVGIILLAVVGGVLATQNAETLGGALPYFIATTVPTALGVSLIVKAFKGAN